MAQARVAKEPEGRDESKLTPREVARRRAAEERARLERERETQHGVEREPMARVVDSAAWRAERPRGEGERSSRVPDPSNHRE